MFGVAAAGHHKHHMQHHVCGAALLLVAAAVTHVQLCLNAMDAITKIQLASAVRRAAQLLPLPYCCAQPFGRCTALPVVPIDQSSSPGAQPCTLPSVTPSVPHAASSPCIFPCPLLFLLLQVTHPLTLWCARAGSCHEVSCGSPCSSQPGRDRHRQQHQSSSDTAARCHTSDTTHLEACLTDSTDAHTVVLVRQRHRGMCVEG